MDVTCSCGTTFSARHPRAKYCSDRCRKRGQRGGKVVKLPTEESPAASTRRGPVEETTRRELKEAGRLDTSLGQMCLALARRLDHPGVDTGSAMASVAARLDDLKTKATKGTGSATAPQQLRDELAMRRARHG